jgi:CBS domain-containing protein
MGNAVVVEERTVRAAMVPQSLYARVHTDQTIREAATLLLGVQLQRFADDDTDRGRRALLVFDRKGHFHGVIRARDIVRCVVSAWRGLPDRPSVAGTFRILADAAASTTVEQIVEPAPTIDVSATLIEAADLMISRQLSHLAVTRRGKLVGMLRPEDLYQEMAAPARG